MAYLCSTISSLIWKYLQSRSDMQARDWNHVEDYSVTCVTARARGLKGWDCGLKCLTFHVICASSQHGGLGVIKFTWWVHCDCSNEQGGNSIAFYDQTLEITRQYFYSTEVIALCLHSRRGTKTHLSMGRELKNSMALCLFVLTPHSFKYKHRYLEHRTDCILQTFSLYMWDSTRFTMYSRPAQKCN